MYMILILCIFSDVFRVHRLRRSGQSVGPMSIRKVIRGKCFCIQFPRYSAGRVIGA